MSRVEAVGLSVAAGVAVLLVLVALQQVALPWFITALLAGMAVGVATWVADEVVNE